MKTNTGVGLPLHPPTSIVLLLKKTQENQTLILARTKAPEQWGEGVMLPEVEYAVSFRLPFGVILLPVRS
jgi:hypothetical protein